MLDKPLPCTVVRRGTIIRYRLHYKCNLEGHFRRFGLDHINHIALNAVDVQAMVVILI